MGTESFAESWCSLLELFVSNAGLKLRLHLVDTVLIKGGRVLGHFYTAKDGYVCRFGAHEITRTSVYQRLASLHQLDASLNPFGYIAVAHYASGVSRLLKRPELQELMGAVYGPYEFGEPSSLAWSQEGLFCLQAYVAPRTDMRYIACYDTTEGPLCTVLGRRFSARYTHAMDDPATLAPEPLSDPEDAGPPGGPRPFSALSARPGSAFSAAPSIAAGGGGGADGGGGGAAALSAEELLVESQLVAMGLLEPRRGGRG